MLRDEDETRTLVLQNWERRTTKHKKQKKLIKILLKSSSDYLSCMLKVKVGLTTNNPLSIHKL